MSGEPGQAPIRRSGLLVDRLERALRSGARSAHPIAVLFLDVDRFMTVNDSRGHHVGDAVLITAARRLEAALRTGDTVGRNGGDEFVVVSEDCTAEQAAAKAERVVCAFDSPMDVFGGEVRISVSVGVALAVPGTTSAQELLRQADTATYAAKSGGRARYALFSAALGAKARHSLSLEVDLRRALVGNELRLHYQPQVRLRDGVVVGREALVRWEHPEHGLIGPADFLALAEDTDLIHPLGAWVIDEALRTVARHRQRETVRAPTMWVNLSAHQLKDRTFVAGLEGRLREHGLPGNALGLEVIESVLMNEADGAVETLLALKRLGVGLAIDDFGTGYSSLSYLAYFPVDIVKMDRSFTSGLDRDETRRESFAVVNAVVGLAHALELEIVAEGVETQSQLQALHGLGCETGQGFLLGAPAPDGDGARD